jgi:N-formylglutamate deformylase
MSASSDWLEIRRGNAPLVVSFPHTGTELPPEVAAGLKSEWLGRRDADWWLESLYDFAATELDATTVRTRISRTAIDCNRDPSGVSLYPGQATTELCPTTTFDGEPLYLDGQAPDQAEIARRRALWFDPYHAAVAGELGRLRGANGAVVLYDAHSIRSQIPRLFEGLLPNFNIGTNSGASCDPLVADAVERACAATDYSMVTNGRFKGGYTTRFYGRPDEGVHAVQMELACRGYMDEPLGEVDHAWPPAYDPGYAAPMRAALTNVLQNCLDAARRLSGARSPA